jgi:hypothetical protein
VNTEKNKITVKILLFIIHYFMQMNNIRADEASLPPVPYR